MIQNATACDQLLSVHKPNNYVWYYISILCMPDIVFFIILFRILLNYYYYYYGFFIIFLFFFFYLN